MTLRDAYGAGLWLLSPSRRALLLKCVLIGVVVEGLSIALIVAVEVLGLGEEDEGGPARSLGDALLEAVLMAPIIETLMMAAVFGVLGRVLNLRPAVCGIVIVIGAVLLHRWTPLTAVVISFAFAAMSIQYARFREVLPLGSTLWGVAVTHATMNAVNVGVTVMLGGFAGP